MSRFLRIITAVAALMGVCCLHAVAQSADEWIAAARIREQRGAFLAALGQFSGAIQGTYGDEGPLVWSSLDALQRAVGRWDVAIREYEATLSLAPRTADLHVVLGTIYIERGRVADALEELAAASRLAPRRADIHALQGLLHAATNRPAAALPSFLKAAALDPDDPAAMYGAAQQLMKLGDRQEATKALQRFAAQRRASHTVPAFRHVDLLQDAPAAFPVFAPAIYAGGFALLKQGRYGEALAHFREAARADPLCRGDACVAPASGTSIARDTARLSAGLRRGELPPVLSELQALASRAPDDPDIVRLLGVAYWADEQYDRSIAAFRAVIDRSPRDERAHVALASSLIAAGRAAEAERALEDAVSAVPDSGQAHYDLGRVRQARGKHADARRAFERALQLGPVVGVSALHQTIAAIHFREGNVDLAIAAQVRRIELIPDDALAHRALGELYMQEDRPDEALAEFVAALLVNPQSGETHAAIGQLHSRYDRYQEAVEASQRAIALDPGHVSARYTLATALRRLGRTVDAERELDVFERLQRAALAREERESQVTAFRGEAAVLLERGDPDAAVVLLRRAAQLDPDSAAIHLQLGRALIDAERPEEAVQTLTRAVALGAGADAHRFLAEAYTKLGRREERERATAAYQRLKQERLRALGTRR